MNTNPLQPEGMIQPKGKSNIKIAIFTILAIHVVLIGGLLIQGCKPAAQTTETTTSDATQTAATATPSDVPPMNTDNLAATSLPSDITPAPTGGSTTTSVAPTTGTVTPTTTAPLAPTTGSTVASLPVAPTPTSIPTVVPTDVPAVPSGETQVHTVAKGEMLSTIARKYHVSVRAVEDANPGINALKLQIGQKLNIPAAATAPSTVATTADAPVADTNIYVVKSGDMLEKIAKAHGTTVKAIKSANNMKTDRINVGQKLKIPTTRTAAAAPATSNQ